MPLPLNFSDDEMDILPRLSAPLDPRQRDAFLLAVANALGDVRGAGPDWEASRFNTVLCGPRLRAERF
jgi:hypothetical protein